MKRFAILIIVSILVAYHSATAADLVSTQLGHGNENDIRQAINEIRLELNTNPGHAIDRLNESWTVELLRDKKYDAVNEFAIKGTAALPADTWRIEQLLKHRVEALLAQNKPEDALAASRSLFNVCSMPFTKDALQLMIECLKAAHPRDPEILARFKLQVLANAQEDPKARAALCAEYGGNSIMNSIQAEKSPFAKALLQRQNVSDYRGLYGTGNLLLLSGRVKEAHEIFARVYKLAPPSELGFATEGIAKVIKAEDGAIGRANQFILSIRPSVSN